MRTPSTFLHWHARSREFRHRRLLLAAIAGLLLLSLTPVVGRHLFFSAHAPLTGIDHIGALCLVALHTLLVPVHEGLHALVILGVAYALLDRGRAWRHAHRTLGPLHREAPAPGDAFWRAAVAAGLPPCRLMIVDGLPVPAFTMGWLSPMVYAARELVVGPRSIGHEELTAVLAHEGAHVARRDPLRFSLLRAMASMLFWIPALRGLADDVSDDAEICADDEAARIVDPLVLASAIVALGSWGARAPSQRSNDTVMAGVVGFVRQDLLPRRIRRLAGEDIAPVSRITRRSVLGALLALAIVWTSGIVDVHTLPHSAGAHGVDATHCEHSGLSALRHLFCRDGAAGGWITTGGSDCPHAATPG